MDIGVRDGKSWVDLNYGKRPQNWHDFVVVAETSIAKYVLPLAFTSFYPIDIHHEHILQDFHLTDFAIPVR